MSRLAWGLVLVAELIILAWLAALARAFAQLIGAAE